MQRRFLDKPPGPRRIRREYPFALIDWTRVEKDKAAAGIYIDLFKHFPGIYDVFKEDVPEVYRDSPPTSPLAEILAKLQKSLQDAYSEYLKTAVTRGILPGVRRITPYTVQVVKSSDEKDWSAVKKAYFQLDSSHGTVFPLVCREEVVRCPGLEERIRRQIENPDHVDSSIAVLGSEGCGKTTLMYRLAVDYALNEFPVLVMDTVVIDKSLPLANYEIFFKKVHALHNAEKEPDQAKPLLVFIDNPHAAMAYMHEFLTHFAKYEETFRFIFILFERETRYWDAEDASYPLKVLDRDTRVIIDNRDSAYIRFREETGQVFARALELDEFRDNRVKESMHKHENISIAEVLLDFYTKFPGEKQRQFDFEWQDLEKSLGRKNLESFRQAYMWTAMVYIFGFPLPVSLLKRLLNLKEGGEHDYLAFVEMIEKGSGFENFPLILEGGKLRTRHELIAGLYVKEKKNNKITPWLWLILEKIDPDEEDEKSIFSGLIFHKNIAREYLAGVEPKKVEDFTRRFQEDHPYYRNVIMLKAWVDIAGRRLNEAKETLTAVLDKFPGFLPAYTELGKIYFEQKHYDEAKHIFEKLLQRDKRNLHARTELSKIYQNQKKWEEAEKVLLECLEIDKNDLNSRLELSKIYQRQKRFPEAEKMLHECVQIDENDLNSRLELSKIYQKQNNLNKAIDTLKALLDLDKKNIRALTELSKIHQKLKRWEEAEKYLLECLELAPGDLNARTELSKIYQNQKKWEEAEKVLLELLDLDKKNLQARTELSKIYQYQKRWEEAEKVLLEILDLDKNDLQARTELSKIYQYQKKWDEAEKVLLESLKIDNNQLHPRTELSKIYQYQKKWEEAEKVLLESLKIDNNQLHTRTELSKIYQRQKRYDEAERILKELLALEPDNIHGCTEYALLHKKWADYQKRKGLSTWWEKKQLYYHYIKESYSINPVNLPTLMELCDIFSTRRQYRAALGFLEKALTVRDQDLETLQRMVRIYHTLYHDTEVHRLLEKGRRWIQDQPFIKYKERFQELDRDLSFTTHKKLVQMNLTGTFSGQLPGKTTTPGPPPVILCSAGRYALMEKCTAHNRIDDGDTVFFATYRVGEKVYADFIEPYFQDLEELAFFQVPFLSKMPH